MDYINCDHILKCCNKMSAAYKSFYETVKYLINPKSSSILAGSGKPKVPNVELNSLMRSWAMLSCEYTEDGTITTIKLAKFHQLFAITFLLHYCLKIIVAMILNDSSVWNYYIGDFAIIYMGTTPRIYIQLILLFAALKSLCMSLYYYLKQKSGKLCWLGIAELIKGNLKIGFYKKNIHFLFVHLNEILFL